jgi:hypothetical protein
MLVEASAGLLDCWWYDYMYSWIMQGTAFRLELPPSVV